MHGSPEGVLVLPRACNPLHACACMHAFMRMHMSNKQSSCVHAGAVLEC